MRTKLANGLAPNDCCRASITPFFPGTGAKMEPALIQDSKALTCMTTEASVYVSPSCWSHGDASDEISNSYTRTPALLCSHLNLAPCIIEDVTQRG